MTTEIVSEWDRQGVDLVEVLRVIQTNSSDVCKFGPVYDQVDYKSLGMIMTHVTSLKY